METGASGPPRVGRPGWLFLCWGVVVLAGCRDGGRVGKLVPVKGKVTLNDKPLAEGTVTFVPEGADLNHPMPEGKIEAGGVYTLTTRGKAGAPVGKYRVLVEPGDDKALASTIDSVYSDPKNSPLRVEVTEDKPAGGYDLNVRTRGRR